MTKEDSKPALPDVIEGASQAWRITAVLQLVLSVLALISYWLHPEMLISPSDAKEAFPELTANQIQAALKTTIVIAFLFAVGICIAFFAIIDRMEKGSEGARAVLILGSIYLALTALVSFFSSGAAAAGVPEALVFISGAVRIASATAAVAGIVLASSKEAKDYFKDQRPNQPRTPNKPHLPKPPTKPLDGPKNNTQDNKKPEDQKK